MKSNHYCTELPISNASPKQPVRPTLITLREGGTSCCLNERLRIYHELRGNEVSSAKASPAETEAHAQEAPGKVRKGSIKIPPKANLGEFQNQNNFHVSCPDLLSE